MELMCFVQLQGFVDLVAIDVDRGQQCCLEIQQ